MYQDAEYNGQQSVEGRYNAEQQMIATAEAANIQWRQAGRDQENRQWEAIYIVIVQRAPVLDIAITGRSVIQDMATKKHSSRASSIHFNFFEWFLSVHAAFAIFEEYDYRSSSSAR